MKYLYLSSLDSKECHPLNNSYDFTIELPKIIEGNYIFSLLEFSCHEMPEELYIFCDLSEQHLVHDQMLPIIRIVKQPGEFLTQYYSPVSRRIIQRVRIYIRDRNFSVPIYDIGPVRCTLALRPI